jgi:cytochrome c oxidase cbb3-type subunit III
MALARISATAATLTAVAILLMGEADQNGSALGLSALSNLAISPQSQNAANAVASEAPAGPSGLAAGVAPYSGSIPAALLLRVPVSGIVPGNVSIAPDIHNPLENDPGAAERGRKDFDAFNCSGCHAANGAGGMGPSLSNDSWIYRSTPANIYLTIVQGRSKGMPAFGAMLPDSTVWELVAYIDSIAEKPNGKFGKTISASDSLPDMEQVSANRVQTADPWSVTEAFHNGQKPQ